MINHYYKCTAIICISLFLSGCISTTPHRTPYIVSQVDLRAVVIAQQTQNHLRPALVAFALKAYNNAQQAGFGHTHILSIIDYSKPSIVDRLWIINLDNNRVLFSEKVAHGKNSGELYALRFSDKMDSKQSSIGMYMTATNGYKGSHGYSLRLQGLEPGFNDQAFQRAIVFHSATYVSDDFIKAHGYLGQTWGCPAINPRNLSLIINTLKGGSLIFIYANDAAWLQQSRFLNPKPQSFPLGNAVNV